VDLSVAANIVVALVALLHVYILAWAWVTRATV
jgi:uncharacterized membrane protein